MLSKRRIFNLAALAIVFLSFFAFNFMEAVVAGRFAVNIPNGSSLFNTSDTVTQMINMSGENPSIWVVILDLSLKATLVSPVIAAVLEFISRRSTLVFRFIFGLLPLVTQLIYFFRLNTMPGSEYIDYNFGLGFYVSVIGMALYVFSLVTEGKPLPVIETADEYQAHQASDEKAPSLKEATDGFFAALRKNPTTTKLVFGIVLTFLSLISSLHTYFGQSFLNILGAVAFGLTIAALYVDALKPYRIYIYLGMWIMPILVPFFGPRGANPSFNYYVIVVLTVLYTLFLFTNKDLTSDNVSGALNEIKEQTKKTVQDIADKNKAIDNENAAAQAEATQDTAQPVEEPVAEVPVETPTDTNDNNTPE